MPLKKKEILTSISFRNSHKILTHLNDGFFRGEKQLNWLYQRYIEDNGKIAVYYDGSTMTYGELFEAAHHLAEKIKKLNRGRVAVYIDNSMDSVVLIHALMQAGVEIVLVNTRLTSCEILSQLEDIRVDTVISTIDVEMDRLNVISLKALYKQSGEPLEINTPDKDDILSIMFTSGTTGKPKAVSQTYLNHCASAVGCRERFGYGKDSNWLLVNPIYHISGLSIVFRTVISGASLYVANKFDEDTVIDMIQKYHITHTSLVPVMLKRLMQKDWHHNLEGILLGGAGATPSLMAEAVERGFPIHNSFGMTETCSQIVSVSYKDEKLLSGSVGRPPNNVSIKVDRNNELLVKAANVTPGYLNAKIEVEDGYFRTGDLAEIDDEGYLYILDRRKDLIISGGENIYPKEIEDVVNSIDKVKQSVVIKRKDTYWGEVPVLLVEGYAELELIQSHLKDRLAKFKQPKEIHYVDEVYMTSTGKVSRVQNKKMYERMMAE